MKEQLIQLLKLDAKATDEQVLAAVTALRDQVNAFTAKEAQAGADEVKIREKMAHGLSRDQAISVIKRQRTYDEAVAGKGIKS